MAKVINNLYPDDLGLSIVKNKDSKKLKTFGFRYYGPHSSTDIEDEIMTTDKFTAVNYFHRKYSKFGWDKGEVYNHVDEIQN